MYYCVPRYIPRSKKNKNKEKRSRYYYDKKTYSINVSIVTDLLLLVLLLSCIDMLNKEDTRKLSLRTKKGRTKQHAQRRTKFLRTMNETRPTQAQFEGKKLQPTLALTPLSLPVRRSAPPRNSRRQPPRNCYKHRSRFWTSSLRRVKRRPISFKWERNSIGKPPRRCERKS